MLINEIGVDPAKIIAVLHFDGTPITARFIVKAISTHLGKTDAVTKTLVHS